MDMINVKGTIELDNCVESDAEEIKQIILSNPIEATVQDDSILFDTDLDNAQDFIESFALFVAKKLPIGHEDMILSVRSLSVDKHDIIIRKNKVFIQYYDCSIGDLEEYKG